MAKIGGNIDAILQQKAGSTINAIGERVQAWDDVETMRGYLDLSSGDSKHTYNAKLQESTHIFLCDYYPIDRETNNKRLVVNGKTYDVLLIDDPMELHKQLEIYLRYVG